MPLLQLLLRHGAPTCGVLGERAQIGLACAAGRVNVGGLDSWLALVEQPPRTDEAPETAGHSQDVPERFAQALEKTKEPHRATNAGVLGRGCCPRRSVLRVSSMAPSVVLPVRVRAALRSRPHQPASHAHRHRRRQRWSAARPSRRCAGELTPRVGQEGFVGLRWAGPGGTAKGPMPDRARRRDEVT